MKHVVYLLLIFSILLNSGWAQEVAACQAVLNYAQNHLPNWGILKHSDGLVYVDLDDNYIHQLAPFLKEEGFEEPPYFGKPELVGAHITVIYPGEIIKYGIKEIQECGQTICFTAKDCQITHPPIWKEIDEVYFLVVEAPELDKIRQEYGLPKRQYDFHITIGVKPKVIE